MHQRHFVSQGTRLNFVPSIEWGNGELEGGYEVV